MSAFEELVAVQQELTDSRIVAEVYDAEGNRLLHPHRVRIPGLLEQLYLAASEPSMHAENGSARAKPKSKLPYAEEAMSRFQGIERAAKRWVRSVRVEEHADVARNIRELVTAAAGGRSYLAWDEDTIEALLTEMRSWRRWAAVMTGWETPPKRPYIKCPVCEGCSTIWVNPSAGSAYCSACDFDWEDVHDLASQVAA